MMNSHELNLVPHQYAYLHSDSLRTGAPAFRAATAEAAALIGARVGDRAAVTISGDQHAVLVSAAITKPFDSSSLKASLQRVAVAHPGVSAVLADAGEQRQQPEPGRAAVDSGRPARAPDLLRRAGGRARAGAAGRDRGDRGVRAARADQPAVPARRQRQDRRATDRASSWWARTSSTESPAARSWWWRAPWSGRSPCRRRCSSCSARASTGAASRSSRICGPTASPRSGRGWSSGCCADRSSQPAWRADCSWRSRCRGWACTWPSRARTRSPRRGVQAGGADHRAVSRHLLAGGRGGHLAGGPARGRARRGRATRGSGGWRGPRSPAVLGRARA